MAFISSGLAALGSGAGGIAGLLGTGGAIASLFSSGSDGGSQDMRPPFKRQLLDFVMSLIGGSMQERANREARGQNEQRYNQLVDLYTEAGPNALAMYDEGSANAMDWLYNQYNNLTESGYGLAEDVTGLMADRYGAGMDRFDSESAAIRSGYDDRYAMAERELEGFGDQMRADVRDTYGDLAATQSADMLNRGLSSSSVMGSLAAGRAEDESAEMRRLQEQLAMNRINTLGNFSGESLAADERLLDAGMIWESALSGDVATTAAQLGQWAIANDAQLGNQITSQYNMDAINRPQIYQQGVNNLAGVIERRTDVADQVNWPWMQIGHNNSSTVSYPSPYGAAAPGLAQGGFNALANGLQGFQPQYNYTPSQYELDQYNAYTGGYQYDPLPAYSGFDDYSQYANYTPPPASGGYGPPAYDPLGYGPPAGVY